MVGLSRAVVVVEGGQRSGARVTATHANDLGREVLAVPGEAGRLLTAAPHALLRDGARLCESADDVMAAIAATPLPDHGDVDGGLGGTLLARLFGPDGRPTPAGMVAQELARGEADADQVARGCGIGASEAAALLSELEVDGFAELARGGRYRLRLLAARELVTASRRH
jgi:DNA processing protein